MVTKVFHLSDIHIRIYKRHSEYKRVFDRLFKSIEDNKDDNSIIIITGDIVHSKLNTSPEMFSLLYYFLYNLSEILPTYVILGNHDLNLKNKNRLNPISPVVEAINSPSLTLLQGTKIHFLKEGMTISLLDVVDGVDGFKTFHKISVKDDHPVVAIYHGIVEGAMASTGFVLDGEVPINLFKGFDATFLGDVHKYQELDYNILYPGSLIQQNFGEHPLKHGYVVWNWNQERFTHDFVQVNNDHQFLVLNFEYDVLDILDYVKNSVSEHTKEVSLSIRNYNKVPMDVVHDVVFEISKKYTIVKKEMVAAKTEQVQVDINKIKDYSFSNKGNSKQSLNSYLDNRFDIPDHSKTILESKISSLIKDYEGWSLSKKSNITVLAYRFNNMFSYGHVDSNINFEDFKGITGIFAENASGKSSFFDSIAYTIFGKCSRTSKASEVLNSSKDSFQGGIILKKGDYYYKIVKTGSKSKSGRVSVNIDFCTVDSNGKLLDSLVGQDRRETEKNIKEVFGTFEDFMHTSFYAQSNNINFIDLGQADRKNLLSYYLNLDLFSQWYDKIKEDVKKISTILDYDDVESYVTKKKESEDELKIAKDIREDIKKEIIKAEQVISNKKNLIEEKQKEIQTIPDDLKGLNQNTLTEQLIGREQLLNNTQDKVKDLKSDLNLCEESIKSIEDTSYKVVESPSSEIYRKEDKVDSIKREKSIYLKNIQNTEESIKEYEKLEYDPECEYCVSNLNIQKLDFLKKELKEYTSKVHQLNDLLILAEKDLDSLYKDLEKFKEYESIERKKASLNKSRASLIEQLSKNNEVIEECNSDIERINKDLLLFYKIEASVKHNAIVESGLNLLRRELLDSQTQREELLVKLARKEESISNLSETIKDCDKQVERLNKKLQEKNSLDYLLKATHRDGLPLELMSNALPFIENKVNELLENYVDFKTEVVNNGKNIDINIHYSNGVTWDASLTSGMEKFLLSLSFKVALSQLTTLNKFNFLVIDEGFGSLDYEKRVSIENYLNNLKDHYDHIFCISHIDSLKDSVDNLLNISTTSGYSSIYLNT